MPFRYELSDNLVIIKVSGQVDNEDHRHLFEEIVQDPNFTPGSDLLLFDKGGKYSPTAAEASELITITKKFQESSFGKFAVVVSNIFHWSVGRLLAAYAAMNNVKFRVFRKEAAARMWLSD